MKKILTFLMIVISVQLFAQNYPVSSINISLPASPDANTANWGSGASVFIINATAKTDATGINKLLIESKILVTIKSGGAKICGTYTSSNAPASQFNSMTKVWSGKAAAALLGQDCILKPGEYTLCVQFFGLRNDPLSEERCKPFSIRGNDQQSYQPPQAISPADGSTISAADIKKPVTFSWVPLTPKPKDDVIYKVRIIEIRQGQLASVAMKSASPIFEKEVVNQTQLVLPSLSPYPIAKGSKYGWYVQATNKEGRPVGGNNGTSNPSLFSTGSCDVNLSLQLKSVDCLSTENGTNNYKVCISATYTSPNYNLTYSVAGSGLTAYHPSYSPLYNISLLTPTLQVQNSGSATTVDYCFNLSVPAVQTTIKIGLQGDDKDPGPIVCQPGAELDLRLPPCRCNDCDPTIINWNFNDFAATKLSNNQYNLHGNLAVNLPIYGVEFQVQSYSYTPTPASCSNGVATLEESGMILMPGTTIDNSSAIQMYNVTSPGSNNNASKAVKLASPTPLHNPLPINLKIGLPGALSGLALNCCAIQYNVCIKVTVFYSKDGCKSCTYTKCIPFNNN